MRKNYVKPALISEEFIPQQYCAVCTHTSNGAGMYLFECNAGNKGTDYNVYFANGNPYATSDDDHKYKYTNSFTGYHPCGDKHEASTTDEFLSGYMYKQNKNGQDSGSKIDVIIWTEGRTDVHCTTNLDQDKWEKNIS